MGRTGLTGSIGRRRWGAFPPEGYAATEGDKAFIVVDSQEAAHHYNAIWNVRGKPLLFDSYKQFHYLGVKEGMVHLVEEEAE